MFDSVYGMPNSLVCRLEASATQNVIVEIAIVVHRNLAIIMLGYDITQWWEIPFRVAEDEGGIAGINFHGLIVSWH